MRSVLLSSARDTFALKYIFQLKEPNPIIATSALESKDLSDLLAHVTDICRHYCKIVVLRLIVAKWYLYRTQSTQ